MLLQLWMEFNGFVVVVWRLNIKKSAYRSGMKMNMNCYACFICVRVCAYTFWGDWCASIEWIKRRANITHPSNKLYFCAINGRKQKAASLNLIKSRCPCCSLMKWIWLQVRILPPRFNRRVSISNVFIHTDTHRLTRKDLTCCVYQSESTMCDEERCVCSFTPISQIKWRALCITKKRGVNNWRTCCVVRMEQREMDCQGEQGEREIESTLYTLRERERARAKTNRSSESHLVSVVVHWGWIYFCVDVDVVVTAAVKKQFPRLSFKFSECQTKYNRHHIINDDRITVLLLFSSYFLFRLLRCHAFRWRGNRRIHMIYPCTQNVHAHTNTDVYLNVCLSPCAHNFYREKLFTKVHFRFLFIKVNFYAISNMPNCVCACVWDHAKSRIPFVMRYDMLKFAAKNSISEGVKCIHSHIHSAVVVRSFSKSYYIWHKRQCLHCHSILFAHSFVHVKITTDTRALAHTHIKEWIILFSRPKWYCYSTISVHCERIPKNKQSHTLNRPYKLSPHIYN